MLMVRRFSLVVVGVLALVTLGCDKAPSTPADTMQLETGQAQGFNLLLITLDTTRPDHLGCYGDRNARTPTIDALARRGILFTEALTNVPITLPAHATILTGLAPDQHGVHDNGLYRLAPESVTLAEQCRDAGYLTAAFVSCFVLDRRFGLDQGFDTYDFAVSPQGVHTNRPSFNERDAEAVTTASLDWLDAHPDGPFFLWVHYFDPHRPFQSPLADDPAFAGRPYDAEIAHVDNQLQRLIASLQDTGRLGRTLVIVAGDHGEGLGDHGEETHGLFLYDSTMKVPMILSVPGLLESGRRVDSRLTGLIDIRPTVEALLGLPALETGTGFNLLNDIPSDRALYLETELPLNVCGWSPLFGLRTLEDKLVAAPIREYYDLVEDPGEHRNLDNPDHQRANALAAELAAYQAIDQSADSGQRTLSPAEEQRLRSLGYVAGGRPGQATLADPKTMLPTHIRYARAESLYTHREYAQALPLAHATVQQSPDWPAAIRLLSFCHLRLGRPDTAIEILDQALVRIPDAYLARALAQALILTDRYDRLEAVLTLFHELAPDDGRYYTMQGDALVRQGRPAEARLCFEKALDMDASRVGPMVAERLARLPQH